MSERSTRTSAKSGASMAKDFFDALERAYGVAKVAMIWYDPTRGAEENRRAGAAGRAFWAQQLGRYSTRAVGLALQSWLDEGTGKVPTLDALIARAKQFDRPDHRPTLPAPRYERPAGYRFPDLSADRSIDGLRWLRRVGSMSVARALLAQATTDWRVAKILEHHIERDFADVVNPESRSFLRAWSAANPGWKASAMNPEDRAA